MEQRVDGMKGSVPRHVLPSEEALGEAAHGEDPLGCRLEEKMLLKLRERN